MVKGIALIEEAIPYVLLPNLAVLCKVLCSNVFYLPCPLVNSQESFAS